MKKVLSLVLAAAMTLGVTATAFAATMDNTAPTKKDTTFTSVTAPSVGISISAPSLGGNIDPDNNIAYGKTGVLTYTATAISNRHAYADPNKAEITLNVHSFDITTKVKGPATVNKPDPDKTTFQWNFLDDDGNYDPNGEYLIVKFDFEVTIDPTDEASVAPKGIVLDVTVKPSSLCPAGTGLKAKAAATVKDITVGYNNIDVDNLYDEVVDAFDEMKAYDESTFEVSMHNNPVIPASVVKFLSKNLGKKSAIFVLTSDATSPVYFDGVRTLELNKAAFDALPANKHINIKTNADDGGWDDAVENETYMWFNYVVPRDIVAKHSLETRYEEPHVYLIDDEGNVDEVTDTTTEDYPYGDVVFTGPMGRYVITEGVGEFNFEDDDEPTDEPIEDDDNGLVDEDGNQIENNPGTGSSNAISLAVAMAVVSLAAAGLVASKKASK